MMSEQNIRAFLEGMEPDDVTDFMQSVSPEVRKSVWDNLSEEAKRETLFLLRFDEDDAAGIMTPRYLAVRSSITVSQAMNFVRKNVQNVETIYYLYVHRRDKTTDRCYLHQGPPLRRGPGAYQGNHGNPGHLGPRRNRPGRSRQNPRNLRPHIASGCGQLPPPPRYYHL